MRFRISILLLLISPGAFAQLKRIVSYYDAERTRLKEVYFVSVQDSGMLNGDYQSYFENGKIKSKGIYQRNKPNGKWEYFYENGNQKSIGFWDKGLRTGRWDFYYQSGTKEKSGNIKNDQRVGEWRYFYENGALKKSGYFEENLKDGLWNYFFETGRKMAEGIFVNDTGVYKEYYPDGNLRMEGTIAGTKSHGEWIYYYPNGKVMSKGMETNGRKNGPWEFYFDSGVLSAEGVFINGKSNAVWRYYHSNGQLNSEGLEKDGEKDGEWKTYYESGSLKGEGRFENGAGLYSEFFETGELKSVGKLVKGVYDSAWTYYYLSGEVEGICEYTSGVGTYSGYYESGKLKMQGMLENGEKTGVWRIYTESGELTSEERQYAKPVTDSSKDPVFKDEVEFEQFVVRENEEVKNRKRSLIRYFYVPPNEFRSIVVLANPFGMIFNAFPIAVEYYMEQRLGYEAGAAFLRSPFFGNFTELAFGDLYKWGFSIDLKQRFYTPQQPFGMIYFAQEVRYTRINAGSTVEAEIGNPETEKTINALQTNYEYTIQIGDRFINSPSRQGIVFDIFLGIGIGYKKVDKGWSENARYDNYFAELGSTGIRIPVRFGILFGYAF